MIAFNISINGKKLFTVGGSRYNAITQSLTLLRVQMPPPDDMALLLSVSGQEFTVAGEDVTPVGFDVWETPNVQVGDKIEIQIVEVHTADAPTTRSARENGR